VVTVTAHVLLNGPVPRWAFPDPPGRHHPKAPARHQRAPRTC